MPLQWFAAQPRNVAMVLFGRDLVEGRETGSPTPVWLESVLLWEFGNTLGRDERFDDMLEHIQLTFDAAPEIARQLDELIVEL